MIKRTKLKDRVLPDYTRGEEVFNMVSHIVGAVMGIVMLVMCVSKSAVKGNVMGIVASSIYCASVILMFVMSAVYHGLYIGIGKKVLRILDHCDIYICIAGCYTPIALVAIMKIDPVIAWVVFGIEWFVAIVAIVFNSIDLKTFKKISFACYLIMGWFIVMFGKITIEAITWDGFMWLLYGGIAFSIGALLYVLGKKLHIRYMHSVFHLFIVLGIFLQFICMYCYVL